MIRGTTPRQVFTFDQSIEGFRDISITYVYNGKILIQKRIEDVSINGNEVSYILTQEETMLFAPNSIIEIQIKGKDGNDMVVASKVYKLPVHKILDEVEM